MNLIQDIYLITFIEPIEQNVHGSKGVYELVYFMKDSKTLERFRKSSSTFDKYNLGKNENEMEKLVRIPTEINMRYSSGRL